MTLLITLISTSVGSVIFAAGWYLGSYTTKSMSTSVKGTGNIVNQSNTTDKDTSCIYCGGR
jgi:hypothetical protein